MPAPGCCRPCSHKLINLGLQLLACIFRFTLEPVHPPLLDLVYHTATRQQKHQGTVVVDLESVGGVGRGAAVEQAGLQETGTSTTTHSDGDPWPMVAVGLSRPATAHRLLQTLLPPDPGSRGAPPARDAGWAQQVRA